MGRKTIILIACLVLGVSTVLYVVLSSRPKVLVLTGLVTTNDVIVSAQIPGQVDRLLVAEGDMVKRDLKNTGFVAITGDLLYLALFSALAMTAATMLFRRTL